MARLNVGEARIGAVQDQTILADIEPVIAKGSHSRHELSFVDL